MFNKPTGKIDANSQDGKASLSKLALDRALGPKKPSFKQPFKK